jgi:hypothetical protein
MIAEKTLLYSKIHGNVISHLLCLPNYLFSNVMPYKKSVWIPCFPVLGTCRAHRSSLYFTIITLLGDFYNSQSSLLYNITHYSLQPSWVQMVFKSLSFQILVVYILPSNYETKLHIHTKQVAKLVFHILWHSVSSKADGMLEVFWTDKEKKFQNLL